MKENSRYEAEILELSRTLVQIDQRLLKFCENTVDEELILPDLVRDLTAARAGDVLRVADECYQRFHGNPYCVAESADAYYKLVRNAEACVAAERVIRRGPYDALMEATINQMRGLPELINSEERLRAVRKQIEE